MNHKIYVPELPFKYYETKGRIFVNLLFCLFLVLLSYGLMRIKHNVPENEPAAFYFILLLSITVGITGIYLFVKELPALFHGKVKCIVSENGVFIAERKQLIAWQDISEIRIIIESRGGAKMSIDLSCIGIFPNKEFLSRLTFLQRNVFWRRFSRSELVLSPRGSGFSINALNEFLNYWLGKYGK